MIDKNYICDYIEDIRTILDSPNCSIDDINCHLDVIQFLALRMENVLIERKQLLINEGYIKCPSCGLMNKSINDNGYVYYKCCGFLN